MLKFKFKTSFSKKISSGTIEKRRYFRFPLMSHLNLKVFIRILPYYRAEELESKLENLSAGGMALRIPKILSEKNFIYLQVILPNKLCIACHGEVIYCKRINPHECRIGVQFLDLPSELKDLILYMSTEYIACGRAAKQKPRSHCSIHCSAYAICNRHEKIPLPRQ